MVSDLSLPSHGEELSQYDDYNQDDAAFALYTLVSDVSVTKVASALEEQWLAQGNEDHLVAPAEPTADFSGKSLSDIVKAHIVMDKGITLRDDGGARGDISWWPNAFIVITRQDWKEKGGLLFVFADDEDEFKMAKFFFKPDNAYMMLSSLSFGDETLARSKELYEADG